MKNPRKQLRTFRCDDYNRFLEEGSGYDTLRDLFLQSHEEALRHESLLQTSQGTLPPEEKNQETLSPEEKSGETLSPEEKNQETLPPEEKNGETLPSEEKNGEPLPSEEKNGEPLPSEEKNQELPSEEKNGETLPPEEKNQDKASVVLSPPNSQERTVEEAKTMVEHGSTGVTEGEGLP